MFPFVLDDDDDGHTWLGDTHFLNASDLSSVMENLDARCTHLHGEWEMTMASSQRNVEAVTVNIFTHGILSARSARKQCWRVGSLLAQSEQQAELIVSAARCTDCRRPSTSDTIP